METNDTVSYQKGANCGKRETNSVTSGYCVSVYKMTVHKIKPQIHFKNVYKKCTSPLTA